MATSVKSAFETFHYNINLSGDHRETAKARKDRLISLLKNDFEILEAFTTGSVPRYTAVKNHADLDIMVVLHYSKHIKGKTPTQVLQSVRDALGGYRTNVRKNGQAVTLHYESWPNVDIVPVSKFTSDGKTLHYNVPNMNTGDWIISKPAGHTRVIDDRVAKSGTIFKRIIKMIKWWNYNHSEYLTSYHIEAIACTIFREQIANEYGWNIFQFFDKGIDLLKNGLVYLGNNVDDYLDWAATQEAVKRFETARDKAREAWLAIYGKNDDHKKAIEIWKQIFGNQFPNYG